MLRALTATAGVLAAALATAAPATSTTVAAESLQGTWKGTLTQKDMPKFTVTATIRTFNPESSDNPVFYGSPLHCRGRWRFLDRTGSVYRFRETITSGHSSSCKGTGTVKLAWKGGDRARYRFSGGGVTSSGTLTRTR